VLLLTGLLVLGGAASLVRAQDAQLATCSGEFAKTDSCYMIEGCSLTDAAAKRILQNCW
jgi:hypothetical protein